IREVACENASCRDLGRSSFNSSNAFLLTDAARQNRALRNGALLVVAQSFNGFPTSKVRRIRQTTVEQAYTQKHEEIEMPDELDRIPLANAIAGLRQQIREATRRAQGLPSGEPRFRIERAEIELTVAAEDSTTAGGEVGWWVFKARAGLAMKDA